MTHPRRPHLVLALGFSTLALVAGFSPSPEPTTFTLPAQTIQQNTEAAFFHNTLLPVAAPSAHAASLAQLQDGTLLAAWFAGTREGADDVAIYLSRQEEGNWSTPVPIATRSETAEELHRHVRKLGNPVLYVDRKNHLHLFFVSVSLGGWAGSAINHKISTDGGLTWSRAQQFITSPFFNISTLVRTPPLPLEDGGLGLPVYHEFIAKHGEWLRLGVDHQPLSKVRITQDRAALQPSVVALDQHHALALMRDSGPGKGYILAAYSSDTGSTWQQSTPLLITNPNSSINLLKLDNGALLLASNPAPGRSILTLHLSRDQGQTWQSLGPVEANPKPRDKTVEFSYPSLIQDQRGYIHMVYTWNRQGIRHVVFNWAWIESRLDQSSQLPAVQEVAP